MAFTRRHIVRRAEVLLQALGQIPLWAWWILALAVHAWIVIPRYFFAKRQFAHVIVTADTDSTVRPVPASHAEVDASLIKIGYRRLGSLRESLRIARFWGQSWRAEVYADKEDRDFAIVYQRVVFEPPRVSFITSFVDSPLVSTSNDYENPALFDDDLMKLKSVVQTAKPERILQSHCATVDVLIAGGAKAVRHNGIECLLPLWKHLAERKIDEAFAKISRLRISSWAPVYILMTIVGCMKGWQSERIPQVLLAWTIIQWLIQVFFRGIYLLIRRHEYQKFAQTRRPLNEIFPGEPVA